MFSPTTANAEFELAKNEFLGSLEHPSNYDFSPFTTINDVYKETERIQSEKAEKGALRNMRRIKPYLDRINSFSGIIETFASVKPEILALIWGPMKLLLQIANTFTESYDKLLEAMVQVGEALPYFQTYSALFEGNSRVQQVLVVFYKDILDFHLHVLNFFAITGWRIFFELLWPKCGKRIAVTLENITRHRHLMDSEVSLANIEQACKLRIQVYAEFKRQETATEHQQFELAKQSLSPRLYDTDLERILDKCCKGTGDWVFQEPLFREWLEDSQSARFLWLIGIPGAGPVFLVVDGLDEIDQSEQPGFLECLIRIFERCSNLRLLFSSRDEIGIARAVKQHAKSIRVNKHNSKDIVLYVKDIGGQWVRDLPFEPSVITELERKLEFVSVKAEGMFLYACLVICNLKQQDSLMDLRQEFENLPNGLTEVYGRILDRIIFSISEKERTKVKRIFKWLGYSKLPLRKEEIACAVTISPGDKALFPERKGFKSFSELCGPIIEDREDHVAFVHFSFKEFIFGSQSGYFLKETEAHLEIALTCMSYLTFDRVRSANADLELSNHVLEGDFVLQSYAESQWFEHLKHISKSLDSTSMLILYQTLDSFLDVLNNSSAENCPQALGFLPPNLKCLLAGRHKISTMLERIAAFRVWQIDAHATALGENLKKFDPLLISMHSSSIRDQMDALLCASERHRDGCICAIIKSKYGQKMYKCNRPACIFFHIGFGSYRARENHIKSHDRQFKCTVASCEFSTLGFTSMSSLQAHSRLHRLDTNNASTNYVVTETDPENIHAMLCDAIKAEEVSYVQSLLAISTSPKLEELLKIVVCGKSTAIFTLILSYGYDMKRKYSDFLSLALKNSNEEIVTFILQLDVDNDINTESAVCTAMGAKPNSTIIRLLLDRCPSDKFLDFSRNVNFPLRVIEGLKMDEIETIHCLKLIMNRIRNPRAEASRILICLGGSKCSIDFAKFLLQSGASVNETTASGSTALSKCCKKRTLAAAEFARFLLSVGASPSLKPRKAVKLGQSPLAMVLPELLGMSWEDLVQSFPTPPRSSRPKTKAKKSLYSILSKRR